MIFPSRKIKGTVIYEERVTGKAIILDAEKNIALVGNTVNEYYLLPGGGIELGENIIDGIIRECKEETGYIVEALEIVGVTEDFRARDKRHYTNYCYIMRLISKGKTEHTKSEEKNGMYTKWFSITEAVELFKKQEQKLKAGEVSFYNTGFNIVRDGFLIKRAKILLNL